MNKLKKLFVPNRLEQELDDEVRFHLEKQVELNVAAGMSLSEARRQALIEFGGVQKTKEDVREQRWSHAAGILFQDTRYAFRMFRKSPGFTAIAVLTLALGIGMNTAIFSLIDAVLFSGLPVSHPEELVVLRWHAHHQPKLHSHSSYGDCTQKRQGDDGYGCSLSLPLLNEVRSQSNLFSGVAAFSGTPRMDLSGNGAATIVNNAQVVSGDYFGTLGVKTAIGRAFSPSDDTPKAEPSVMLSYGYWKRAFGGSPDAVGRTIRLNGIPFTIIGVAAPGFNGLTPGRQYDLWLPLSTRQMNPQWTPKEDDAGSWWVVIVGRLKPGVSAQQAETAVSLLFRNEALHEQKPLFTDADAPGVNLVPAQQGLDGGRTRVLQPLYVLMLAVALVLLIACANIAGLLLARAAGRSREIAVRLVLGAKRSRLVSQLLVESLLLSFMGGALGLMLALWSARGLMVLANNNSSFAPHLDWRVLAFTAATAILTGLFFGLVPAFRSLRVDLTPALKSGSGTSAATSTGAKWYSLGNLLVVAQVSLAVVALVTAGLLVRTLSNLKNVTIGFDPNNVLLFGLDPSLAGYKGSQLDTLNRDLQEQFAALPGVQSVSYSSVALLTGSEIGTDIHIPGTPENEQPESDFIPVGPRFFQTMGIPLKTGRDFTAVDFAAAAARSARPPNAPADPKAAPTTIIVNEAFVRQFFPRTEPLGQHIEEILPEDPKNPRGPGWEIVGVVGDTKYDSLRREVVPMMYMANAGNAFFEVRTANDPLQLVPIIRDMVNRKDGNLAMFRITTESQEIDNQVSVEQLIARLATFFGLLALVLACVGLYGLLSYEVTRRTREIGIRMAIGAQRSNVIRLVVVQGIMLAAVGAVVGSAASLAVTRLLKTALYGVTPGDPITLVFCAALLLVVAMAACYLPARRATRVDPLVALRYE